LNKYCFAFAAINRKTEKPAWWPAGVQFCSGNNLFESGHYKEMINTIINTWTSVVSAPLLEVNENFAGVLIQFFCYI